MEDIPLIIYRRRRWGSSVESTKPRPGADCGSDHELRTGKFRLKLKKVREPLDYPGMTLIKSLTIIH